MEGTITIEMGTQEEWALWVHIVGLEALQIWAK